MFTSVFGKLLVIEQLSDKNKYKESWGSLSIEGNVSVQVSFFEELYEAFKNIKIENTLSFFINNSKLSFASFINELSSNDNWRININKNVINANNLDYQINFFYSLDSFSLWIKDSNPFLPDYFANQGKYKVFVNGLKNDFGGENFVFCSKDVDFGTIDNCEKYDESAIANHLHVISTKDIIVKPRKHLITFGELDDISRCFYRNSIKVLLLAIANEYNETSNEIIVKGYRRLSLKSGFNCEQNNLEITKAYQDTLFLAIKWIYETDERADLRLKLFLERVTLDINISLPFIQSMFSVIEESISQAKERYSFITYERKDLFDKELKDLLNDTKKLCDSFSTKIRNVLSNLLRDVLAAFIMIGITQMSKIDDISKLSENHLLKYVFLAFGIYFIASACFQLIVDISDVVNSYHELKYWKKITKEYMIQSEYDEHIKNTVTKRLKSSGPIYFFLIALYVAIGIGCFKLPLLLSYIK